jgi:hypothetical protein
MTQTQFIGETSPRRPVLLTLTVDCPQLAQNEAYGQGNWITAWYMVRMATALAQVDVRFACVGGTARERNHWLLPWLEGYYTPRDDKNASPFIEDLPTGKQVCTSKYKDIRIDKIVPVIQRDMRQMAQRVVQKYQPKLDDVAIHFRCGDVLGGQFRNDFGMIPFREYIHWIDKNNTTSIGIVTQPFQVDRNREVDGRHAQACERVVHKLVDYLQGHYPNATIRIHNHPDTETFPMAYARLVLARQAFTTLSSFGIFPVIATYGQGYFQKGNEGVNPWATHVPKSLSNIHEMDANVLGTLDIYNLVSKKGWDPVMEWFVAKEEDSKLGM